MTHAIRGSVVTCIDNPFLKPSAECVKYEEDGLIVIDNGIITDFGPASTIAPTLSKDIKIKHYGDALIIPGFIDCHVHYPQTQMIGAFGKQLIDWLNKYAFAAERDFDDKTHATQVARFFLRECLRSGTTTASVFCTTDPISVDAFFEESSKLNMRNIAGKVLMDRNAPVELLDTPQKGYDQTKKLIERWHGKGRQLYSVTPRFAPTSSPEQMEMTGAVWNEHPGTYLQTHVSENKGEIEWVKQLYPNHKSYVDVYQHYGHLGERSVLGHAVHLTEAEFQTLYDTGTAISHCPTSNLFLGSGVFSIENAMKDSRPIRVGLATDLGAGTSFSQLVTMNEAYKIAQLDGYPLSAIHAYYLSTLGAANALYLDDKIGSIEVGKEADITVLDKHATPLQKFRMNYANDWQEELFIMMTLGDDRNAKATYVAGELVYGRESTVDNDFFVDALN